MAVKREREAGGAGSRWAEERLTDLSARGGLSAAALRVARGRRTVAAADWGWRRLESPKPLGPDDLFDAASLTKPFVATLALRLDTSGALPLDLAVGDLLPGARLALARERLESLLRHRSGLAPWYPLEKLQRRGDSESVEAGGRAAALIDWFAQSAPIDSARGRYSDLGYLLWGLLAERATGRSLGRLLRTEVTLQLGIEREAVERPPASRVVECALDGRREEALAATLGLRLKRREVVYRGVPQDGNARFLGRLCGHAGLFVSAAALLALGAEWARPGRLLAPDQVGRALAGSRGVYALGWARRRRTGSSGIALSREAFGHTGFTGGSLWIDPERNLLVSLLAHRKTTATDLNPLRRELHRRVVSAFAGDRDV